MALFNHQRILKLHVYNGLATNKDRMAFIWMVRDYMAYLRAGPPQHTDRNDDEEEKKVLVEFIRAIRSDAAWPLARQVVPEFQEPWCAYLTTSTIRLPH